MLSNLVSLAFSLLIAGVISGVNQFNGNPYSLTLRGKRVLFVMSVVFGIVITQFAFHFYVDCDLQAQANATHCAISWR